MSGVRRFVQGTDLSQVAELHGLVFGRGQPTSPGYLGSYKDYFCEVFLNNPWRDDALPSLVYENEDGHVSGFLGVIPRTMLLNGQPLRVAISAHFMVHPKARGRVGLQLLSTFFFGRQDVSITEGNDQLRTVWEGLGGTTLPLYSIRWTRPLRPSRFVLSFLKRHDRTRAAAVMTSALTPFAFPLDGLLGHLVPGTFRVSPPDVTGEALTADTLLAGLFEVSRSRSLYPHYDQPSLEWLFTRLADKNNGGCFRSVLVCNTAGDAVGWYLYYLTRAGISQVVQVAAKHGAMGDVLSHLFYDAQASGAAAVSGQLDPGFIQPFSEAQCLMHGSGGSWVLAHAKRPDRLEPLYRGDAWFTRLDGEWWVGF